MKTNDFKKITLLTESVKYSFVIITTKYVKNADLDDKKKTIVDKKIKVIMDTNLFFFESKMVSIKKIHAKIKYSE